MWNAQYRAGRLHKRPRMTPRPLLTREEQPIPSELHRYFHTESFVDPSGTVDFSNTHFYVAEEYREGIANDAYYGKHELTTSRDALRRHGTLHLGDEWQMDNLSGAETPINDPRAFASAYYEAWKRQALEIRKPGVVQATPFMKNVPKELRWSIDLPDHKKMLEYAQTPKYVPFWDRKTIRANLKRGSAVPLDKDEYFMQRISNKRPIWLPRMMEQLLSLVRVSDSTYEYMSTQEIAWTPHSKETTEQRRAFVSCITSVKFYRNENEYNIPAGIKAGTDESYGAFVQWWGTHNAEESSDSESLPDE